MFGIYEILAPGAYAVYHPDDRAKFLGTVFRGPGKDWHFEGPKIGAPTSRPYPTREDACRGLRGVAESVTT